MSALMQQFTNSSYGEGANISLKCPKFSSDHIFQWTKSECVYLLQPNSVSVKYLQTNEWVRLQLPYIVWGHILHSRPIRTIPQTARGSQRRWLPSLHSLAVFGWVGMGGPAKCSAKYSIGQAAQIKQQSMLWANSLAVLELMNLVLSRWRTALLGWTFVFDVKQFECFDHWKASQSFPRKASLHL